MTHCPICKKRFWKHSLNCHIVHMAQREVYVRFLQKGHVGRGSDGLEHENYRKSRLVTIKKLPTFTPFTNC